MSAVVASELTGALAAAWRRNFDIGGELGAAVSVWRRGREVASFCGGWMDRAGTRAWTEDALVPVFSATKGPAAAALLVALESRGLGVETPVCEVWPGFPVEGGDFGQLLSHQCGLPVLDEAVPIEDHEAVVAALERQSPRWLPGEGHGYHPRTFGALLDEPVRRLTGMPLGAYWLEEIAGPMGLEFWIGLPEGEWGRVAELVPGRGELAASDAGFYRAFHCKGSLTQLAFDSPRGLRSAREMNDPRSWALGNPAMGGVGSARGLARFYQAVIGAVDSPLSDAVRRALLECRVSGDDRVLLRPTAFTAGCMCSAGGVGGWYGGSGMGVGHSGAGGSHAFGDPVSGLSFAYVMNRMAPGVMPGERCRLLLEAVEDDLTERLP